MFLVEDNSVNEHLEYQNESAIIAILKPDTFSNARCAWQLQDNVQSKNLIEHSKISLGLNALDKMLDKPFT